MVKGLTILIPYKTLLMMQEIKIKFLEKLKEMK